MAYKAMVNGKKVEYKRRVALEIIRQYIRIHNNITINELKNIFNIEKFCSPNYIIDENEKEDFIIKRGKEEFERRYFSKEDEVIVINNEKIYVCGEWNGNDLNRLIQFVNDELGMEVYSINELENQQGLTKNDILMLMKEFKEDHIKTEGEAKYFFKIIDDETLYPRRFIVNEARKRLGLDEITTIQAKKILDKLFNKNEIKYIEINNKNNSGETKMKNETKTLNQILYGPSGTGKTYNTINRALAIIENKSLRELENEDREELKRRFDEYKKAGQIEFVTFHQSYGYEEFVEGIKAESDENENISYKIEDGIFKKICKKASVKEEENIDKVIEELKNQLEENYIEIDTEKTKFKVTYRGGETFRISPENSKNPDKDYPVNIEDIKKLYRKEKTRNDIYNSTYSVGILNYLYKKGLKKYEEIENKNSKSYVLIIDEINRGNISKIFGELITLIEESKRIGADEEIKVRLPYSNEEFGVPKNLYILGTMNTADRSIALLDTALRRRFEFIEMMPKPELLEGIEVDGIDIKNMLEIINKRIEYLYDRDHMIGHSYFMSLKNNQTIEELTNIFRNKIIPLLQEYFYDDWEKIKLILNDNGMIKEKKFEENLFKTQLDEYDDKKVFYIDESSFKKENFISIYKNEKQ